MQKKQGKSSYREELAERILNRFPTIKGDDGAFAELFAFVSEVALESFKNGLAAGRRRPGAPQQR